MLSSGSLGYPRTSSVDQAGLEPPASDSGVLRLKASTINAQLEGVIFKLVNHQDFHFCLLNDLFLNDPDFA